MTEPARGGVQVGCRIQRKHSNRTLALRVDHELAWCTDTALDEENADFARGVRMLFHESFYAAEASDEPGPPGPGRSRGSRRRRAWVAWSSST
jgi:ribonuclease BN (tRNA processing enzyme)